MSTTLIFVLCVLLHTQCTDSAIKIWNAAERGTQKWELRGSDENCAKHNLVYGTGSAVDMNLPTDKWKVASIVLPSSGVIILNDEHPIQLSEVQEECSKHYNNYMVQHEDYLHPWFSSESWITENERVNSATPHMDRIPCDCDLIVFPTNTSFSVKLDFVDSISISDIMINGVHGNFKKFVQTELGQHTFAQSLDTTIEESMCPSSYCTCHSNERFQKYKELVCMNDGDYFCPTPQCIDPITPIGSCCPVCGGLIQFEDRCDKHTKSTVLNKEHIVADVREAVRSYKSGKYLDLVDISVNAYPNNSDISTVFQITIVDRGEYYEYSPEIIKYIFGEHLEELGIATT